MADEECEERTRPVVQDSEIADNHVEIDLPARKETIVMDDEIAQSLAEDILRIIDRDDEEATQEFPSVGTKVVKHWTTRAPLIGEVVPADAWGNRALPPGSFVVEFPERTCRFPVDRATTTGKAIHIDP